MLQREAEIIASAWQYPEKTCVRISSKGHDVRTSNYRSTDHRLIESIKIRQKEAGFVEVGYIDDVPPDSTEVFLEDETRLLSRLKQADEVREARQSYLKVLEQNLQDVASSFATRVTDGRIRLSPREMEVSNLVKNGMGNKEISDLLGISVLTVERHRHNIRRKLGISREKVNLATYLHEL